MRTHKALHIDGPEATHDTLAAVCLHLRAKKIYKKQDAAEDMVICTFAIAAEVEVGGVQLQRRAIDILTSIGAERRTGPPPRGELERAASRWITTLTGK